MEKEIMIGLYVLIGVYILYRLFSSKSDSDKEYKKIYNEILDSEKYKVKGQYEK